MHCSRCGAVAIVCALTAITFLNPAEADDMPDKISIQPIATGGYELSGGALVDGGLLLADDELVGAVLFLPGGSDTRAHIAKIVRDRDESAPYTPKPRLFAVQDFEGLASDGEEIVYLIGSHAPDDEDDVRQPDREFLIRAEWDFKKKTPRDSRLKDAELSQPLLPLLAPALAAIGIDLALSDTQVNLRLNIEGLAFDPASGTLYIGLRGPLTDASEAVLLAAPARDLFKKDADPRLTATALDLDGGGIRGMGWDRTTSTLLILSGPEQDATDPRPMLWRQHPAGGSLAAIHTFTDAELGRGGGDAPRTPEGIIRMPDGKLAILMDPEGGDGGLLYLEIP